MKNCAVCSKAIPDDHPALHNHEAGISICMGCEGAEIEVFKISLPGEKSGYVDRDFDSIIQSIRDMDVSESYTISKQTMPAAQYLSLPDFDGF